MFSTLPFKSNNKISPVVRLCLQNPNINRELSKNEGKMKYKCCLVHKILKN